MKSRDDGEDARPVQRGRKAGHSVSGAPYPPGRSQRDGPERPTRQVPTEPNPASPGQTDAPPPTAAQEEEDEDGT
jgi:hypothetical protein